MVKAKRMLRRLESVTYSMPSEWFTYRNYLVKDPSDPSRQSEQSANGRSIDVRDGVFTQSFAGGYTWRFSGNLASTAFQQALMGKKAQEVEPTRVQPYRTAKGAKAAKKVPKKQRRLTRVQQRSMVPDESSQETALWSKESGSSLFPSESENHRSP